MKIIIHELFQRGLRQKNICCNNYHTVRVGKKTAGYGCLLLFLCMFGKAGTVLAQTDSATNVKKVNAPKKEGENLNVLHDWMTWNNPGSLALNFLTGQAENYYRIRNEVTFFK